MFLSFIHDCRLPLTSIKKLDGEGAKPLNPQPRPGFFTPTLLPPPHPYPHCELGLSLCLVGELRTSSLSLNILIYLLSSSLSLTPSSDKGSPVCHWLCHCLPLWLCY